MYETDSGIAAMNELEKEIENEALTTENYKAFLIDH